MPRTKDTEPLVECPYEETHMIAVSRMPLHLVKCGRNHPSIVLQECPFNASHKVRKEKMKEHLRICVDRDLIDVALLNPNRSSTVQPLPPARPTYEINDYEENWDDDLDDGFGNQAVQQNAFIPPRALPAAAPPVAQQPAPSSVSSSSSAVGQSLPVKTRKPLTKSKVYSVGGVGRGAGGGLATGNPNPNPLFGNPNPNPLFGNPNPNPLFGNPNPNPLFGNPNPNPLIGNSNPNGLFGDAGYPSPSSGETGGFMETPRPVLTGRGLGPFPATLDAAPSARQPSATRNVALQNVFGGGTPAPGTRSPVLGNVDPAAGVGGGPAIAATTSFLRAGRGVGRGRGFPMANVRPPPGFPAQPVDGLICPKPGANLMDPPMQPRSSEASKNPESDDQAKVVDEDFGGAGDNAAQEDKKQTIKKLEKKLRQIKNLEASGKELNNDEVGKVSLKPSLEQQLARLK